ncbi:hypothetical protein CL615_02880 [archaeon]|jgi:hypothetical protein|nr:hypothetical protein [archaeon]MDP6547799.1 hypothetical protein [Candidatus Woesearchaeota archaeon]|tara:strand:- start:13786 stop:14430 length:645 start_codon:yes stop_codon:yes gene_type:complete
MLKNELSKTEINALISSLGRIKDYGRDGRLNHVENLDDIKSRRSFLVTKNNGKPWYFYPESLDNNEITKGTCFVYSENRSLSLYKNKRSGLTIHLTKDGGQDYFEIRVLSDLVNEANELLPNFGIEKLTRTKSDDFPEGYKEKGGITLLKFLKRYSRPTVELIQGIKGNVDNGLFKIDKGFRTTANLYGILKKERITKRNPLELNNVISYMRVK